MENVLQFLRAETFVGDGLRFLLFLIMIWLVVRIVKWIENHIGRKLVLRTKTKLDDKLLDVFSLSSGRLIWIIGLYFALHQLTIIFSQNFYQYIDGCLYVLAVLVIVHFINRVLLTVLDWYSDTWGKKMDSRIRDEFGPLFRRLIVIAVYLTAVVIILKHFDQEVSSIVVSLGVGSLAIALAAKDTLANMISGFTIMTDRPFRVGDRIMLETGEKGDVFDIGLRSTRILTFDNTLIVVPNQQIVNEKVTNLSYPNPQIRVIVEVGVAYGTDLNLAKDIMVAICNEHSEVLDDPAPASYFLNFGDSSLDLRVTCYVPRWGLQWQVAEEIRLEVYKKFTEAKIEIPFPQRVITMQPSPDDKES